MSKEEKEAFIAEAVKGLDAEGQVHAAEELSQQLSDESEYGAARERLRGVAVGGFSITKICLIVLLIVSFILMLKVKHTSVVIQARDLGNIIPSINIFSPTQPELPKREVGFTTEEKRIVYGNMNLAGSLQIWEDDPENAAVFAHYLERYEDENDSYPENTIEIVEKIDPDNGLYYLLQGVKLEKSVGVRKAYSDLSRRITELKDLKEFDGELSAKMESELESAISQLAEMTQYKVKDEKQFEEAVSSVKLAFSKPYIKESYKEFEQQRNDIILNRLSRDDFVQRSQCSVFIGMQPLNGKLKMVRTAKILSAYYEKLIAEGNTEEIKWWIPRHIQYWQQRLDSINSIVGCIVLRAEMNGTSVAMLKAAKFVGLSNMEEKLDLFNQALKKDRAMIESPDRIIPKLVSNKLSILMRMTAYIETKAVADINVKEEALLPSRYTDHAITGRVFSTVAWLIFALIFLVTWLYRFIKKTQLTPLGLRFRTGLAGRDWVLILGLGILVPVIVYWGINHLTELSAREWAIYFRTGVPVSGQFYAMFLAIITMSLCVIRWRVAQVFSIGNLSADRMSWILAGASFLAMISAGLIDEKATTMYWLTCGLTVLVSIYLLVKAVRFLIKEPSIEKFVLNRVLTPVLAVAMLMMTVLTACFYEVEKHYIAKDTLLSLDPNTGYSNYESIITKQVKKELQKRLNILNGLEIED